MRAERRYRLRAYLHAAACGIVVAVGLPSIGMTEQRASTVAATAPTTLRDALASASSDSAREAASAVADALSLAGRVRDRPRAAIAANVVSQPQSGTSPQYQAAIEYTLDFGSNLKRTAALRAAGSALAQATATLAQRRRATSQAVIAAYFAVASAQTDASTQGETVALAGRTLAIARARAGAGIGPALDVERASAALATDSAALEAARENLAGTRRVFRVLVPTVRDDADVEVSGDLEASLPSAEAVVVAALARDADVAAAAAAVRGAELAVLAARAEGAPVLSAGLGPGISRTGAAQSVGPAATIALDVPLASGLDRSNVAAAEAGAAVARDGLETSRRAAAAAALRARADAAVALARLGGLRAALTATRRVADADLAGYRIGAVPGSELLLAQSQVAAARAALANATVEAAAARAALDLAMGAFDS